MAFVLLVDDDRSLLRAFRVILEAEGFHALTVHDGKTALSIALANPPDVIVTDYMMPGCDGIELCRRLKSMLRTVGIPVIMLTATFPPPPLAKELSSALLTKPISVRDLLRVIRSLLRDAAARDDPRDPAR